MSVEHCIFPGGYSPYDTRGTAVFREAKAQTAIEFFEKRLVHIKGEKAGQPLRLEKWQSDIIGSLFGWYMPDKTRRYRMAYIEIPRKNGKSTLSAGIALLLLYMSGEPGAEIYSAAADREQAAIVFEIAKENVLRNPLLEKNSTLYLRSIVNRDGTSGLLKGSYKVLSADAHTKHGYNPYGIIFDELHAQPNRELWDVLNTGTGARRDPLTVAITTAGFDRHSICYEQRQYAEKVRDGVIDDHSFLPVIWAASETDDWTDPQTWRDANPNINKSVSFDYLERECKRAQETPTYENTFKRLHLNLWTEQDVRWLPMDKWDRVSEVACGRHADYGDGIGWRAMAMQNLAGSECVGGLDLSTTQDITAFALVFDAEEGTVLLPFFWVPGEGARQREKRDRVPYVTWANQGFITLTDGDVIDYDVVRRDINELGKQFNIRAIARDRWNAAQITTQLQGDGFDIKDWGQGYAMMSAPSKEFEKRLIGGKLLHGGNPVLRWMANNVAAEIDAAGNIKPSKKKSTERIDGIVACVMGIGLLIGDQPDGPSIYENFGNLAL